MLDLPGIIEGAAQGKGRGRQVIAVAKSADLVLMMLDATKPDAHKAVLEAELESTGIRLNKQPADIYFRRKKTGAHPSHRRERASGTALAALVALLAVRERDS